MRSKIHDNDIQDDGMKMTRWLAKSENDKSSLSKTNLWYQTVFLFSDLQKLQMWMIKSM